MGLLFPSLLFTELHVFFFPPLVFLNVKAEEKADLQTRGSHYT